MPLSASLTILPACFLYLSNCCWSIRGFPGFPWSDAKPGGRRVNVRFRRDDQPRHTGLKGGCYRFLELTAFFSSVPAASVWAEMIAAARSAARRCDSGR